MKFLRAAFAIFAKDLLSELRERKKLNTILFFGVLITFLFSFAFGADPILLKKIAPGLLWLVILFSSLFALEESFDQEIREDCLDRLVLFAPSIQAVFLGKLLANLVFILLIQIIVFFFMFVLFGLEAPQQSGWLAVVLLAGSLGLATLGTFYSGLTGALKARQVLLPLLLFPMLIPLLLASILASQSALTGDLMGNIFVWLKVIAIFDLVFLAACWMVWPVVLES